MTRFAWTEDLDTGSALIDGDHHRLVDLVNLMFDAMEGTQPSDALSQAMDELVAYTREHFAREESAMDRIRYVAALAHKSEHAKLIRQIVELQGILKRGGRINIPAVSDFLGTWLREHILGPDMKLAVVLNGEARRA